MARRFSLLRALLFLPFFLSCSAGRNEATAKRTNYQLAPQTTRGDILTESRWSLLSYGFTIEYGDPNRNYEALRTNWRALAQTLTLEAGGEQTFELRDRAVLHLSPRTVPTTNTAQVASRLEFFMQTPSADRKKWLDISPDPALQEQYRAIVQDIQDRLRHHGYQF